MCNYHGQGSCDKGQRYTLRVQQSRPRMHTKCIYCRPMIQRPRAKSTRQGCCDHGQGCTQQECSVQSQGATTTAKGALHFKGSATNANDEDEPQKTFNHGVTRFEVQLKFAPSTPPSHPYLCNFPPLSR